MKPTCDCELGDQVRASVERYFSDLNGAKACGVYQMVMDAVEKPLLDAVMGYAEENRSKASEMLGINRGTLSKKLQRHGLGG